MRGDEQLLGPDTPCPGVDNGVSNVARKAAEGGGSPISCREGGAEAFLSAGAIPSIHPEEVVFFLSRGHQGDHGVVQVQG